VRPTLHQHPAAFFTTGKQYSRSLCPLQYP
jgi:hypothetical protein